MDTRRSFNKDDAQNSFATNASDNHPSETHVTVLWPHMLQLIVIYLESH